MKYRDQIAELRRAIPRGNLSPAAMAENEFAYSQQLGIARNTVRRRIFPLIDEGRLERRPGKGFYVSASHTATRTVQVIAPDLSWTHVVRIARGAQAVGAQSGLHSQVYDAHGQLKLNLEVLAPLMNRSKCNGHGSNIEHRVISPVWEPGASLHAQCVYRQQGADNMVRQQRKGHSPSDLLGSSTMSC